MHEPLAGHPAVEPALAPAKAKPPTARLLLLVSLALVLWGIWEIIYHLLFFDVMTRGSLNPPAAIPYIYRPAILERSVRLIQGLLNLLVGAGLGLLLWPLDQRWGSWRTRIIVAWCVLLVCLGLNLKIGLYSVLQKMSVAAGEPVYNGPAFLWPF